MFSVFRKSSPLTGPGFRRRLNCRRATPKINLHPARRMWWFPRRKRLGGFPIRKQRVWPRSSRFFSLSDCLRHNRDSGHFFFRSFIVTPGDFSRRPPGRVRSYDIIYSKARSLSRPYFGILGFSFRYFSGKLGGGAKTAVLEVDGEGTSPRTPPFQGFRKYTDQRNPGLRPGLCGTPTLRALRGNGLRISKKRANAV